MRQQYKRQSFAAWAFWLTLLVGGTLYGASRFDWFDMALPHVSSAAAPSVAQGNTSADGASHPLPPDGQIQVTPNSVGPQSEPPPEADDSPAALLERVERLERAQGHDTPPDRGDPVPVDTVPRTPRPATGHLHEGPPAVP